MGFPGNVTYTDIKTDWWCFANFADILRHGMINAANK